MTLNRIFLVLFSLLAFLALTGYLVFTYGNPQWHLYIYEYHKDVLKKPTDRMGFLLPPPNYDGTWTDWRSRREKFVKTIANGELERVQHYTGETVLYSDFPFRNGQRHGYGTSYPSGGYYEKFEHFFENGQELIRIEYLKGGRPLTVVETTYGQQPNQEDNRLRTSFEYDDSGNLKCIYQGSNILFDADQGIDKGYTLPKVDGSYVPDHPSTRTGWRTSSNSKGIRTRKTYSENGFTLWDFKFDDTTEELLTIHAFDDAGQPILVYSKELSIDRRDEFEMPTSD